MSNEEKLLKMKREISSAKTKNAEIEGAIKQTMKSMKSEFSLGDLASAEKRVLVWKRQRQDMGDLLQEGIEDLENKYEW